MDLGKSLDLGNRWVTVGSRDRRSQDDGWRFSGPWWSRRFQGSPGNGCEGIRFHIVMAETK